MADAITLISTITVGSGGAASIDFTSIPQTGTDLYAVYSLRDTDASTVINLTVSFNGSFANHSWRYLRGDGSTAASNGSTGSSDYARIPGSTATSNTFGNGSLYIPNYTGSTNKSLSFDSVAENNATSAWQQITAGLWSNTAAITRITFSGWTALAAGSTVSLYTITKGSGGASVS